MRSRSDVTTELPLLSAEHLAPASHLITPRRLYTHHGLYLGQGRVIHYAGFVRGPARRRIVEESLQEFAQGRGVFVLPEARCFATDEVIARARSRLGEHDYRILSNNCEHFCAWALRGESRSTQVERLFLRLNALRIGGDRHGARNFATFSDSHRAVPWSANQRSA